MPRAQALAAFTEDELELSDFSHSVPVRVERLIPILALQADLLYVNRGWDHAAATARATLWSSVIRPASTDNQAEKHRKHERSMPTAQPGLIEIR
jgi:hypothetical protein